jgi:hypothetical protein
MKAQRRGAMAALRTLLAAIDNAEFIETECSERDVQAERLTLLGRADEAGRLRLEAEVIACYRIPEG